MSKTTIIGYDKRLGGLKPILSGCMTVEVDGITPLSYFVKRSVSQIAAGGLAHIWILAHGLGFSGTGNSSCSSPTYNLGYGVSFCREGINSSTLTQFLPLRDKVDRITFFVCGAAHITRNRNHQVFDPNSSSANYQGNGHAMCSYLARNLRAEVVAATETQAYSSGSERFPAQVNFGRWEGLVAFYDRMGNLDSSRSFRSPSVWTNSDGELQGNW